MKREIITINENGQVSVPDSVQMRDFEIAELFEVMIPIIRSNIRAILKSGMAVADTQNGGTFFGSTFYPDYLGLDIIMTLAFRIQSPQAEVFRRWVLSKATIKGKSVTPQIFLSVNNRINRELN